jgi:thiol-disulfide isomerase/thioredoxin
MKIRRRLALQLPLAAAVGTLAATSGPRKPSAATLPPLAKALEKLDPPTAPPDATFLTQDGASHHLSEFKGRGMVVNMWATWCVPCVAEMPSLETLSKALAPQDIAVLPLSSDRGGAEKVASWYQEHGITALPVLIDPKGALARAFEARGLPTTVIINTAGLVVARLEGAADWAAPEAQAMIKALTAG